MLMAVVMKVKVLESEIGHLNVSQVGQRVASGFKLQRARHQTLGAAGIIIIKTVARAASVVYSIANRQSSPTFRYGYP